MRRAIKVALAVVVSIIFLLHRNHNYFSKFEKETGVVTSNFSRKAQENYFQNDEDDLNSLLEAILKRKLNYDDKILFSEDANFDSQFESESLSQRKLDCSDINSEKLTREKKLGGGLGKLVYEVKWNGRKFAMSQTRDSRLKHDWIVDRVIKGYNNLLYMPPNPYTIPVHGHCQNERQAFLITESCSKHKDLFKFMTSETYQSMNEIDRFKLAIQIVASFNFLSVGMGLPRVHCDLHTINESLTQYLVADDLRVFMGDVDELPLVDVSSNNYAKCKWESFGKMKEPDFLAPEQRYSEKDFKEKKYPGNVTEKANVWKIPNFTNILITGVNNLNLENPTRSNILNKLSDIHKLCKKSIPLLRPTSGEVLKEYLKILQFFKKRND